MQTEERSSASLLPHTNPAFAAVPPSRRPWKALGYYGEEDAELFFGREADREALLSHIISARSTVLYGASGAGKTSLINAAIIPALRAQGYRTARFRVSDVPLATLRAAIYRAWPSVWSSMSDDDAVPGWLLADAPLRPGARAQLQELLSSRLGLGDLQILVANLQAELADLNYDNLEGGLDIRISQLLLFLDQRRRCGLLVRDLYQHRPDMRPDLIRIWAASESRGQPTLPLDQIYPSTMPLPPLVVICDEFEKFFLDEFIPPAARVPFIAEIVRVSLREDLPLTWLFSLRKEALGDLFTYVEPQSKSLIANLYRLDPLTREEAAQAVLGPALQSNLDLEDGLVEMLLNDLEANGEVSPPQLQLVCDALYDQAKARRTNRITLSDYQSIGGTSGILQNYLAGVLERFPLNEIQAVKGLLIQLAGAQQTTLALSAKTLAERLEQPLEQVEEFLEHLAEACLIRQVLIDGQVTYELTHAYLINEINTWLGHEALALRRIQNLVAQGTRDQELGVPLPLSAEALDVIFPHRTSLRLAHDERRLVWQSAVLRGERLQEWCTICSDESDRMSIVYAEPPLPRLHVIEALRWIATPAAEQQLLRFCIDDRDLTCRRIAAERLAELESTGAQDYLIAQWSRVSSVQRAPYVAALAIFRDREKLRRPLSLPLRLGVERELVGLRLRRNRAYIVYLAIGAALGSLPLFTILKEQIDRLRLEPMGIGMAIGLGVGQAISQRHRTALTLLGGLLGGLAGGLISGLLNPDADVRLPGVILLGLVGALYALFSASGMLLAIRKADTPGRRTIGLMLGGAGIPLALLGLMLLAWLVEGSNTFSQQNLSQVLFAFGNAILIGLGIGLAEYLYRRDEHV